MKQSRASRTGTSVGLGGWIVLLALCLAGCATAPKVDWSSRVGSFSYDQAILELGPPDRSATLTDGTRVVEWLTWRGSSQGYVTTFGPHYSHPYLYGPPAVFYSEPPSPDRFLRLTFGPDGKLVSWQRVYR